MREARVWKKLRHSNVLPLIGLFDIGGPIPILISPFCGFGHVGGYLQSHPDVNRNHLVVLYTLTHPPACINCDRTGPQCSGRAEVSTRPGYCSRRSQTCMPPSRKLPYRSLLLFISGKRAHRQTGCRLHRRLWRVQDYGLTRLPTSPRDSIYGARVVRRLGIESQNNQWT
jgi:hypothetical protein